jgi:hypothetical protein
MWVSNIVLVIAQNVPLVLAVVWVGVVVPLMNIYAKLLAVAVAARHVLILVTQ